MLLPGMRTDSESSSMRSEVKWGIHRIGLLSLLVVWRRRVDGFHWLSRSFLSHGPRCLDL